MNWLKRIRDRLAGRQPLEPESVLEELMSLVERGTRELERRQFKKAVDSFTRAMKLTTPQAGMLHHRGSALAELHRHREAIVDYTGAIQLLPTHPDLYLDRGNSHHALDEFDHAVRDYTEAIRIKPNFAKAFANRAAVHAENGRREDSDSDAAKARELGVDEAALDILLAESREKASR